MLNRQLRTLLLSGVELSGEAGSALLAGPVAREAQQLALADAFPESMRERVHAPPPHGAVVPRLAVGELEDDDDD